MDYSNDRNATELAHRPSTSRSSSSSATDDIGTIERSIRQHEQLNHASAAAAQHSPSPFKCFLNALTRKKPLDCRTDTNLNRCLNLLDLTALGVGSTLGLGLYVLAGQVACNKAGPGVVISFALAALASAFSALCYAEFAGKVPKAGSAYAYSYITVGEFVAFIIGWNLILEYVIGASSVARGFSGYLRFVFQNIFSNDTEPNHIQLPIIHNNISNHNITQLTIRSATNLTNYNKQQLLGASILADSPAVGSFSESIINYVSEYFDWPSVLIITLITMFVLFGVKESTNVTMAFTSLNLLVVLVVVVSSVNSLDLNNWRLKKSQIPAGSGEGGFLPFGWSGVLAGSATCFFGFIGFDTIASSAEEAKNPKKNVPLSIILSLFISFLAYMAVATIQTLLWPYYDQNRITILPHIFSQLNMPIVYWIVIFGAIAGLASSQLGGMYPLPRILYSMANDKLIYGYLAHVNRRLKLPVRATIVGSVFVALLSCLLDIQDLADMVSIGTLAAYSLVSLSVLILRYEDRSDAIDDSTIISNHLTLTDILNTIDVVKDENNHQVEKNKSKLSSKLSTQIREKGSKPLVPQLSVGFNSWFKNQDGAAGANQLDSKSLKEEEDTKKVAGYLDLLIKWKTTTTTDKQDLEQHSHPKATNETSRQSKILIAIIVILCILIDLVALCFTYSSSQSISSDKNLKELNSFLEPTTLLSCVGSILLVLLATSMLMLSRLPVGGQKEANNETFQVPLVPLIPTLSIIVNTFLMLNLSYLTWVRFTVWMAVGLFIYFTYGIWNSEGYLLYLDRGRE